MVRREVWWTESTLLVALQERIDSLDILLVDKSRPGAARVHYLGNDNRPEDGVQSAVTQAVCVKDPESYCICAHDLITLRIWSDVESVSVIVMPSDIGGSIKITGTNKVDILWVFVEHDGQVLVNWQQFSKWILLYEFPRSTIRQHVTECPVRVMRPNYSAGAFHPCF